MSEFHLLPPLQIWRYGMSSWSSALRVWYKWEDTTFQVQTSNWGVKPQLRSQKSGTQALSFIPYKKIPKVAGFFEGNSCRDSSSLQETMHETLVPNLLFPSAVSLPSCLQNLGSFWAPQSLPPADSTAAFSQRLTGIQIKGCKEWTLKEEDKMYHRSCQLHEINNLSTKKIFFHSSLFSLKWVVTYDTNTNFSNRMIFSGQYLFK